MVASVQRFASRAQLLRRDKAAELRQLVLGLEPEAPDAIRRVLAAIDRNTSADKGWSFVMLSPAQNAFVVGQIDREAKRPRLSFKLWALCFCHLRTDTGEICLSRKEMAEAIGALPRDVSSALHELEDMNALIRHQEGREVRWFMNPMVGTNLTGAARENAQRKAGPLRVVRGGR